MRISAVLGSIACCLAVALFLPISASAADTPQAVLMACSGEITVVTSTGETVAGGFGYQLHAGDVVRTGRGSSAEILFDDGNSVAIGAGSSMQIKARRTAATASTTPQEHDFEVVQNFLKLKDSGGTSSIAGLRSAPKAHEIQLESPCQTRIRSATPDFHWSVYDRDLSLCLTIYDDNGIFWKTDLEPGSSSLSYPDDAPGFEPGVTYSWMVETSDPLIFPPLRSQAAFFEQLKPEDSRQLEQSLQALDARQKRGASSYDLCRASLFFEYNLFEDAITETKNALDKDPDNIALHAILARLYAETGRNEDALREYDMILDKK